MASEDAFVEMKEEYLGGSDNDSDVDQLCDSDEEIKESLKTIMSMPLEFIDDIDDNEPRHDVTTSSRSDSVERQMEALFVDDKAAIDDSPKNSEFENISDNEFDGPESGECDTSDGELPDSPKVVVTMPDLGEMNNTNEDTDCVLKMEYHNKTEEYYNTVSQKINVVPKTDREVIMTPVESQVKHSDTSKSHEKTLEKPKVKEKKEKKVKNSDHDSSKEEKRQELKMKKYLDKCLTYLYENLEKTESKESRNKNENDPKKNHFSQQRRSKLKSIIEKTFNEKGISSSRNPFQSSGSSSSRINTLSSSLEKGYQIGDPKQHRPVSSQKESRTKLKKKSKSSRSRESKEYHYRKYLEYLQSERDKPCEEKLKRKSKVKRKHKKSASPEVDEGISNLTKFLSFPDFCKSRELVSPDTDVDEYLEVINEKNAPKVKERKISIDSQASTSKVPSEEVVTIDDDKELFITLTDLKEQDKLKNVATQELETEKIEDIVKTDPELKSISVFTRVLFKESVDSSGIPFLQESSPQSPTRSKNIAKHKPSLSAEPDEIYDWNDDLSNISQISLSPSRSPAPKVHNKALLNFLENQKDRQLNERSLKVQKKSKYRRSRSRSPINERLKKKKKHRYKELSLSPSPPRMKSLEYYRKRSPVSYLKERWRDYPSSPDRRRDSYDRPSSRTRRRSRTRSRPRHRSRSSSEDRRRYRTSPPMIAHTSGSEKRRLLKEEHERACASLRATLRIPTASQPTPKNIKISFTNDIENPRDNYDPVVMNEVPVVVGRRGPYMGPRYPARFSSYYSQLTPCYYYPPYH